MSDRITGRTALVTGAGNGIGRAISAALSAAGARVILVGRNASKLEETQALLSGPSATHACDVASEESVGELAQGLHDESIDILVNNAGVAGPTSDVVDLDLPSWEEVFATNVRGVFLMCRAFLPPMLERGDGDILNIASVTGKRPLAHRVPYAASKMAVLGLTISLADEVGHAGVMVNSLSPGPVDGERMHRNFERAALLTHTVPQQVEAEFVARSALKRMVTEEEVAAAAVAVLSMRGLTGADIDLSAGMIAR